MSIRKRCLKMKIINSFETSKNIPRKKMVPRNRNVPSIIEIVMRPKKNAPFKQEIILEK
ncbi:hypothetical protein PAHAL_6G270200 [Panicum hallii]|jgi:hypothetical protein|uniref:Uncharacterized protein n=1 Tax=Panicum hallii TaxID=206008 RepID=A0A2T8IHP7_9POAL|nr:hypothetical protein PAHAL_6G270200 [Panicum hallii]